MKILILSERFYPEEFLINDLARQWKQDGYRVEILSQVPSYPYDKIFSGYRNRWYQTTNELDGIPVHRVRTVLGYNTSVGRKILNYINFAFLTGFFALFCGWRYDRVFTFHSGPLTMASAGLIFRFVWWRKCMIWTQDVWPDSVYNYGIKPSLGMRIFLNTVVRMIYWGYNVIAVSCPGFRDKLKPYTHKKIKFLPQWTTQNIALPEKPKSFPVVFTFAGNIGSVQNLDLVVKIFGAMRDDRMLLRLVGGGVYLERIRAIVAAERYDNIEITGRLPLASMPEQFALSDVLIISLKEQFDLTILAKFQAYIAAGRPVLGLVRGDTAEMIKHYDVGLTADPADPEQIAGSFVRMTEASADMYRKWRENGLKLSAQEFSRDLIIAQISELLTAGKIR